MTLWTEVEPCGLTMAVNTATVLCQVASHLAQLASKATSNAFLESTMERREERALRRIQGHTVDLRKSQSSSLTSWGRSNQGALCRSLFKMSGCQQACTYRKEASKPHLNDSCLHVQSRRCLGQ